MSAKVLAFLYAQQFSLGVVFWSIRNNYNERFIGVSQMISEDLFIPMQRSEWCTCSIKLLKLWRRKLKASVNKTETMDEVKGFGAVDFAVFIGMLIVATAVGFYYAIKDRKKENMETYYFGGRKMSPIPVGLSISVTFISAITIIAYPSETYLYGNIIIWFAFASFLPTWIAWAFYIPLVHRLRLSSIYEYLEKRFHYGIRKLASLFMCLVMTFYMSTSVYVPGLALNAVTPLSLSVTIILTSLVCTLYTTLGGMKAVVWTDTLQSVVMLAGTLAVFIKTTVLVGGYGNVVAALERGGRFTALNFNLNPTIRYTFWSVIIGRTIGRSAPNQAIIQRYLSCNSVSTARKAALVALVPDVLLVSISVLSGMTMYAYYENCDPLLDGKIPKPDQLMPYLVVDVFHDVPGMAGLFVAAAFSGTLSTVSSGINSLAALIMEDFILPWKPKLSNTATVITSKLIVMGFGVLVTIIALSVQFIDATVMRIGNTISGILSGPLTGVFVLGMFFPWANAKGAAIGQAIGTLITGWIGLGSILHGVSPIENRALPASTEGCRGISISNMTYINGTDVTASTTFIGVTSSAISEENPSNPLSTSLYAISYLYMATIALVVTVGFGLIGSFLTGANKASAADPKLFIPMISHPIFPARMRKFFRFGVPEYHSDEDYKMANCDNTSGSSLYKARLTSSSSRVDELKETD